MVGRREVQVSRGEYAKTKIVAAIGRDYFMVMTDDEAREVVNKITELLLREGHKNETPS